MSEVEALTDRVSIIRHGRIVQTGTLEDLRGQTRLTITATLANPPEDPSSLRVLHDAVLVEHDRLTAPVEPDEANAAAELSTDSSLRFGPDRLREAGDVRPWRVEQGVPSAQNSPQDRDSGQIHAQNRPFRRAAPVAIPT